MFSTTRPSSISTSSTISFPVPIVSSSNQQHNGNSTRPYLPSREPSITHTTSSFQQQQYYPYLSNQNKSTPPPSSSMIVNNNNNNTDSYSYSHSHLNPFHYNSNPHYHHMTYERPQLMKR